ncbi:MAG: hypothetical protein ACTIIR_01285, partial [Halomonas sp.]
PQAQKPRSVTPPGLLAFLDVFFLDVSRVIVIIISLRSGTMIYRALTNAFAIGFVGYCYGWRFSDARSVLAATSDRVRLGGHLVNRCTITES